LPLPYFRLKLTQVRECPDFWGPLLVVLAFALLSLYGQFSVSWKILLNYSIQFKILQVISWILTFWFVGSYIIFFLARMLGGDVGYTQCLGIIGYCLIPLVVTGLVAPLFASVRVVNVLIKVSLVFWIFLCARFLLYTVTFDINYAAHILPGKANNYTSPYIFLTLLFVVGVVQLARNVHQLLTVDGVEVDAIAICRRRADDLLTGAHCMFVVHDKLVQRRCRGQLTDFELVRNRAIVWIR
jgi:hypothetical protein